ncbi:uncharacterized protein IWZ02DRAFT_443862 [Phyllosticta citriasiana]|uniref:uncharacterized protein n=1 Tax=Phyllosticta citriasiana TaxID=595635 RepID=UPI0030FD5BB9
MGMGAVCVSLFGSLGLFVRGRVDGGEGEMRLRFVRVGAGFTILVAVWEEVVKGGGGGEEAAQDDRRQDAMAQCLQALARSPHPLAVPSASLPSSFDEMDGWMDGWAR